MLGSGIAAYSREKLTPEQDALFCAEVEKWIENEWLIPHDPMVHGSQQQCYRSFLRCKSTRLRHSFDQCSTTAPSMPGSNRTLVVMHLPGRSLCVNGERPVAREISSSLTSRKCISKSTSLSSF